MTTFTMTISDDAWEDDDGVIHDDGMFRALLIDQSSGDVIGEGFGESAFDAAQDAGGDAAPPRDRSLTPTEMVRQFHEVFGAPIAPEGYQGLGDEQLRRLRAELIREEFVELLGALGMAFWDEDEGVWADPEVRRFPGAPLDRVEVADALGDLVYVIYGAALSFGIDLDAVVAEIHRSNMTKLGADGKPIYREGDQKVLKGPAYERPQIARVLGMEE